MSKAQSARQSDYGERWPFAVGAFLVGLAVCVFMPPLLLVIVVAMMIREVAAGIRRTPVSVGFTWALSGFGAAAVSYLVLAMLGGITW